MITEIISFIKLFTILGKTLIWLVFPHSKPMQLPTNGKFVLSFIPLQTVFEEVFVPDWFVVLLQQLFHVQALLASVTEKIFPSNQSDNNQIVRIFIFFILYLYVDKGLEHGVDKWIEKCCVKLCLVRCHELFHQEASLRFEICDVKLWDCSYYECFCLLFIERRRKIALENQLFFFFFLKFFRFICFF